MLQTTSKPKICTQCGTKFTPARPLQRVCSPICARRHVNAAKVTERASTKARKAAIATIPELKKKAQHEFNAYIRARDAGKPCICCGKPLADPGVGGGFDAGHYRSTGSADHLRFAEDNVHGQSKSCNRYGAGRAVDYRIGLIERIGIERVEAIEHNNTTFKWTRELLIEIAATYRSKRKALEEQRNDAT